MGGMGNNYNPMVGVYWYNPEDKHGMYRMTVTKKEDMKQQPSLVG